ncbi:MAG TPA: 5,6-dimethylbenzimidazole synthase [Puia sp.]|nr:5,6-dimethylbenzimidazole synthase [Puia sp.]
MDALNGKFFTPEEAAVLQEVILHRRDVRGNRFVDRPVDDAAIDQIITAGLHAPSVGFSQPWEFVVITDRDVRHAIRDSFDEANAAATQIFSERDQEYCRLKLEGVLESAVNIAVFYKPAAGPVLGQTAMPEVGLYSVVCAVQNMWLMARALNIGLGWVSILDPEKVKQAVGAAAESKLVAYLCVGYTDGFYTRPELELLEWERRKDRDSVIRKI